MPSEEDLLREATALKERMEVSIDGDAWLWGRRANGAVSVFCGEMVWQFNTRQEIRRAFADNHRLKSEQGRFVRLERIGQRGSMRFHETVLDDEQQNNLLEKARDSLATMAKALERPNAVVQAADGDTNEMTAAARQWLNDRLAGPLVIAEAPHAN